MERQPGETAKRAKRMHELLRMLREAEGRPKDGTPAPKRSRRAARGP